MKILSLPILLGGLGLILVLLPMSSIAVEEEEIVKSSSSIDKVNRVSSSRQSMGSDTVEIKVSGAPKDIVVFTLTQYSEQVLALADCQKLALLALVSPEKFYFTVEGGIKSDMVEAGYLRHSSQSTHPVTCSVARRSE